MKPPYQWLFSLAVLLSLAMPGVAQEPAGKKKAKRKTAPEPAAEKSLNYLPKPLAHIRGNILDLESTGYFAIDAVELRTLVSGDEALVWTVRVKKVVTCRHIEALIREYRDVRFYASLEKSTFETFSTVMQYSRRIELGSSNNVSLAKGDIFELNVIVPPKEMRRLSSLDADRVVFRRWKY